MALVANKKADTTKEDIIKKWIDILKKKYDVVEIDKVEIAIPSELGSSYYSFHVANNVDRGIIKKVVYAKTYLNWFGAKFFSQILCYENLEIDCIDSVVDFLKDGDYFYHQSRDKHYSIHTQEILEDVWLKYAEEVTSNNEEFYFSYRGYTCDVRSYSLVDKEELVNLSDIELYSYFTPTLKYIFFNSIYVNINFYLFIFEHKNREEKEFSFVNKNIMKKLRERLGIGEAKLIDAKDIIISESEKYLSCGFNFDRYMCNIKKMSVDDIRNIAKKSSSATKFKSEVCKGISTGNGGGSSFTFGLHIHYDYNIKKPDFQLFIYSGLIDLYKDSFLNSDGFDDIPDDILSKGYEKVMLFNSNCHDIFDLYWKYIHKSVYILESKQDALILRCYTNENFKLDESLLEQKKKIANGASLLDLI